MRIAQEEPRVPAKIEYRKCPRFIQFVRLLTSHGDIPHMPAAEPPPPPAGVPPKELAYYQEVFGFDP
ncbi:MAG TPA: hypothetical protein VKK79_12630, partial [Candidatus Lokiarchaeia archaeon]|nr:hypothetical protein [Candidatus Lokiarchaeia archaeon]